MTFFIKRREKDSNDPTETIPMSFPSFTEAVQWMESENENENREYDIAAVSLS